MGLTATLFLDVDGVLSPIRGPTGEWDDWEEAPYQDYFLVLSRSMARRLAELPVAVVWLTTWRQQANTHSGRWLGWKAHRVIDPGYEGGADRWKVAAVRAHIEDGGGPFVWIDDDLDVMAPQVAPLVANHRHLLVAPNPVIGLTRHDLERVEGFLLSLEDAG
ncbi:MAG: HAD domain-containing protein [Acidimicrobiales bacterium]